MSTLNWSGPLDRTAPTSIPLHTSELNLPLEVCPLSFCGFLVQALPSTHKLVQWRAKKTGQCCNLHLALNHGVNQLELSLGHLNDLLDQTGTDLVLEFLNSANGQSAIIDSPAQVSSSIQEDLQLTAE